MTQPAQALPDPFALWSQWLSQSERQWNQFLNEAMATDQFSQSMGRMMDVSLNFQKQMSEVMGRYFSLINIPTRTDILGLGDRLQEIEQRLTSIEGALGSLAATGAAGKAPASPPARAKPKRTRKPAS